MLLLSKCLGHCLAKPKMDRLCLLSNVIFRNFFPSKMTKCYVHSRSGLSSHCCSSWLPGSEVPDNALCDSSPRPLPVCRRSEGDRQGQQNLPELQRPLCGLWGDSRKVCHGPEANDLEFVESLLIQIIANFFQSRIYGLSGYFRTC